MGKEGFLGCVVWKYGIDCFRRFFGGLILDRGFELSFQCLVMAGRFRGCLDILVGGGAHHAAHGKILAWHSSFRGKASGKGY